MGTLRGMHNRFKYICNECQAENWITSKERTSRFIPRCRNCGSTWLEPSKRSTGPDRLRAHSEAKLEKIKIMTQKMNNNELY